MQEYFIKNLLRIKDEHHSFNLFEGKWLYPPARHIPCIL